MDLPVSPPGLLAGQVHMRMHACYEASKYSVPPRGDMEGTGIVTVRGRASRQPSGATAVCRAAVPAYEDAISLSLSLDNSRRPQGQNIPWEVTGTGVAGPARVGLHLKTSPPGLAGP